MCACSLRRLSHKQTTMGSIPPCGFYHFWLRACIAVLGTTFFNLSRLMNPVLCWIPALYWTPVLHLTFASCQPCATIFPPHAYHLTTIMLTICLPYAYHILTHHITTIPYALYSYHSPFGPILHIPFVSPSDHIQFFYYFYHSTTLKYLINVGLCLLILTDFLHAYALIW